MKVSLRERGVSLSSRAMAAVEIPVGLVGALCGLDVGGTGLNNVINFGLTLPEGIPLLSGIQDTVETFNGSGSAAAFIVGGLVLAMSAIPLIYGSTHLLRNNQV